MELTPKFSIASITFFGSTFAGLVGSISGKRAVIPITGEKRAKSGNLNASLKKIKTIYFLNASEKALKRNLGGQAQQVTATPKTSTTELPAEEPISESDENLDE